MEAVREGDVRRGVYQLPRRTFAGDDIEAGGMEGVEVETRGVSGRGFEGRGDWAQREEERLQKEKAGRRGVREMVRVLGMGRRDSIWTLRGRRKSVKGTVGNEDEAVAVATLEKFTTAGTEEKTSRRASFLARLRWHPSQSA